MNVVCAGEVMVEFSPDGREHGYRRGFAGDSYNTAVYLARCGTATRYLTRLGDDMASEEFLRLMATEGIGSDLVGRQPGGTMGLYLIDNDASGERTFTYYRDSSPARNLFDTPLTLTTDVFYFTGVTLAVTRSGHQNLLALLKSLRAGGTQVVFDPNYRAALWEDAREARTCLESVLPLCDLVLPTLADDKLLWNLDTSNGSIDFYRDRGVNGIVVKGDDLEATVWSAGECARMKAEAVPAMDTTGAGDGFNAAYLASRLGGKSLEAALQAAQSLAARVVQHRGAILPRGA